ncbi:MULTISPECIES: hypothetical protein [Acetobacter]|uniref:hypothetical protein n=1 Tax=Acetobacter TaxID=434 RepID=UPI002583404A|nr:MULTISPECIES: hypothetical protein [Acetobacter]MCC6106124.1 hypothetical protein [Acetobacter sp.]MDN7356327.1 hypothetical protein [Acetobacter senegalensis]
MDVAISRVDRPMTDYAVTPHFRYDTVEDIEASRREKRPVMKTIELCEMRIAGEKNYIPTVPADSIWQVHNGQPITYAERFAEQYRNFKLGNSQTGEGTPLQELVPYGITQAQLSLCRALKIYSIEAVNSLEGIHLKALGVAANELKRMAGAWIADHSSVRSERSELEELRALVEKLQSEKTTAVHVAEEAIEDKIEASAFAAMDDRQLKTYIKERTGQTPMGNPSRETLLRMAEEA